MSRDYMSFLYEYQRISDEIDELLDDLEAPDMPKLRDLMSRPSPFRED